MSTSRAHATSTAGDEPPQQKTYYESQREMLVTEIAQSLEHVLVNINRLNRSMEELIQVGNEFAPVESLWSHFESVMGNQGQAQQAQGPQQQQQQQQQREEGAGGRGGAGKKEGDGDVSAVAGEGEGEGEGEGDESMY